MISRNARAALEFAAARSFLDSLPFPQIVVPGNHDVPLHDVMRRWLAPLEKYRQFISGDVEPFYADDEVAIQGLSTARSLTWKNGRINRMQVERTCTNLTGAGPNVTRIVVTHHPFDLPGEGHGGSLVGRAAMAIAAFTKCRVDMILSGHFHLGHAASWTRHYPAFDHAAILVQAGTATSSRRRDEANSWNLIRIERPEVVIERQTWEPARKALHRRCARHFSWARAAGCRCRTPRSHRHERADACHAPKSGPSGALPASSCRRCCSPPWPSPWCSASRITSMPRRAAGINRWASPNLTLLAEGASFIGSVAVLFTLTALTAAGLWLGGRPRAALMLLLVMGCGDHPQQRREARRSRAHGPKRSSATLPDSFSFASGHALFSACYFGVVAGLIAAHVARGWQRAVVWVLTCSIIAGIGLSRVYLGVHYLTDVIAGFALAALIVCIVRGIVAEQR